MRIIAYYQRLDANVMRRVIGPISVASNRGTASFYHQVDDLYAIETGNYNAILLPNVSWEGKLPPAQGEYIYDLSDSSLLKDEGVLNVLTQCNHVFAPTETIAKNAKPFCGRTHVVPSLVHAEWLFSTGQDRPTRPILGCVGSYNWSLVLDGLLAALKEFPEVLVVTTSEELFAQLPEKRRAFVQPDVQFYPKILRSCYLGIFPGERRELDPGPIREFGLFGIPVIAGPAFGEEVKHGTTGLVAHDRDSFLKSFRLLTTDDRVRSRMGAEAQVSARESTAVRGADSWLRSVGKACPTSLPPQTIK